MEFLSEKRLTELYNKVANSLTDSNISIEDLNLVCMLYRVTFDKNSEKIIEKLNRHHLTILFCMPTTSSLCGASISPDISLNFPPNVINDRRNDYITANEFVELPAGSLFGAIFSINDLISAYSYTGLFHITPDNPLHMSIYKEIILKFPDFYKNCVMFVGAVIYKALSRMFTNSLDAVALFGDGPMIINKGAFCLPTYRNTALETPIRHAPKTGLRFEFDIGPNGDVLSDGTAFSIGGETNFIEILIRRHRIIGYFQDRRLFSKAIDNQSAPIIFAIEIYPTGHISIYENGRLRSHINSRNNFFISPSKLVIGANLLGKESAEFVSTGYILHSIRADGYAEFIQGNSLASLNESPMLLNPYDLERPCQKYFRIGTF